MPDPETRRTGTVPSSDRSGTLPVMTSTPAPTPPSSALASEPHSDPAPAGAPRVAVVTGASSGIGAAVAARLAADGWTVVAAARRADRLDEVAGAAIAAGAAGRIIPAVLDVADTASTDALAQRVEAELGACHLLVCNAGVGGGTLDGRGDLDGALRVLDVNLLGTLRCLAAFADLLARSAPSQVVNVASVAGKLGLGPAAYVASKFGMVGLSEALEVAWADRGITVTQLNPGFIHTEGFPQAWADGTPIARLVASPEQVAEVLVRAVRRRRTEVTVPRWYRTFVVLRHVATPVWRAVGRAADGPRRRHQASRAGRQDVG
jgi:NAD(P)-dependent dehydrogenase (short-subunit alcohol dehydrogenase family)